MKASLQYTTSEELFIVNDSEQLNLFEKGLDMNSTPLKYPRRTSRSISNTKYSLDEPTEATSRTMKNISSSNTKIEQLIEEELKNAKLNYTRPELLIEKVAGKPDFVLPRYRIVIFCDGDFWHGHDFDKSKIKSNTDFWAAKIERNVLRDDEVNYELKNQDWKIFRFWEHDIKNNAKECISQVKNYIKGIEQKKENVKFTFVDLFAGIGGFRIPLEKLGGKCLGFSEIDKYSIQTYKKNFLGFKNSNEIELGSITDISKLPFNEVDLIVGGVPCQSWSVAGKMRGFDDPRGKLWDDTIRVVKLNKPKAFIFENVKGLIDPRNKENLELIVGSFEKIGYIVQYKLLNSYDFGLPQNRDRIFIVGIRKDCKTNKEFKFPVPIEKKSFLFEIIDGLATKDINFKKEKLDPKKIFGDKIPFGRNRFQKNNEFNDFFIFCDTRNGHTTIHSWEMVKTSKREKEICLTILKNRRKRTYGNADGNPISLINLKKLIPNLTEAELQPLISKKILKYIQGAGYEFVNSKNSAGINGVYRIYLPHSNIFSTLTATGTKDMIALKNIEGKTLEEYKQNFIDEIIKPKNYKQISGREAGKLQGFPNWFSIHNDEKLAKKQFGNAVSTSVIHNLAQSLLITNIFK